jgi:hypothetical protein
MGDYVAARLGAALAALLLAGCASPAPASPSTKTSTATAAPSSGGAATASMSSVPSGSPAASSPLLLVVHDDHTSEAVAPLMSERKPLIFPPGDWTIAVGRTSLALTPAGSRPTKIVIGVVAGNTIEADSEHSLPEGSRWDGAYAACVWDQKVVVADAGLALFLLRSTPLRLPDQRNNRGTCAWLDPTHVVWDQEDNVLRWWRLGASSSSTIEPMGRRPSAGGSRFAWTDMAGNLTVADLTVDGDGVTVGGAFLRLPNSSGRLSADGQWLLAFQDDTPLVTIYSLEGRKAVKEADVALLKGDQAMWLPQAP